ncbi:MAG: isocitrate lyase/phosphoenolpyruvate mutase family protein [Bacteroidota bacterium]
MNQHERAATFRQLHHQPPLVLPNAWDAGSARVIEQAGASAIATTSAGVSWAHGRRDGQGLPRAQAVEAVRHIVETVAIPVSADIEGGYGDGTPDALADTVRAMLDAGVVGVNIEDTPGRDGMPIRAPAEQAARIQAAREAAEQAGIDLFINARTDLYLRALGDPGERLEATLERAALYLEAGADSLFVPGVTDVATIRALAAGIDAPLNILAGVGAPGIPTLAELGVARVSLGPEVALGAFALMRDAVQEVLSTGTYRRLDHGLSFGEIDALFADRSRSADGPDG